MSSTNPNVRVLERQLSTIPNQKDMLPRMLAALIPDYAIQGTSRVITVTRVEQRHAGELYRTVVEVVHRDTGCGENELPEVYFTNRILVSRYSDEKVTIWGPGTEILGMVEIHNAVRFEEPKEPIEIMSNLDGVGTQFCITPFMGTLEFTDAREMPPHFVEMLFEDKHRTMRQMGATLRTAVTRRFRLLRLDDALPTRAKGKKWRRKGASGDSVSGSDTQGPMKGSLAHSPSNAANTSRDRAMFPDWGTYMRSRASSEMENHRGWTFSRDSRRGNPEDEPMRAQQAIDGPRRAGVKGAQLSLRDSASGSARSERGSASTLLSTSPSRQSSDVSDACRLSSVGLDKGLVGRLAEGLFFCADSDGREKAMEEVAARVVETKVSGETVVSVEEHARVTEKLEKVEAELAVRKVKDQAQDRAMAHLAHRIVEPKEDFRKETEELEEKIARFSAASNGTGGDRDEH